MKLPELKNRLGKKYVVSIVAGVLAVSLITGTVYTSTAYAATNTKTESTISEDGQEVKDELNDMLEGALNVEEKDIQKEETVYVIADANGNATSTIVTEWLKNPEGASSLEDVSEMKDIENVKGDETFSQNGSTLSWNASGNDIYYRGTLNKETPVTEKVTYMMDGKEMSAEEIAGKSGKLTVRIDYTNHATKTVQINGKDEEIYIPFIVASGMVLDDSFKNVSVSNGRVISNGDSNIAFGYAMPGLKESLAINDEDLSEDFSMPDYVEFTADVENFEISTILTVVTTSSSLSMDDLDLSKIDDKLDELQDASGKLQDGSRELADGIGTLNDSMEEFKSGVGTLKDGIASYTDGAKQVADGIATLNSSVPALSEGVTTISNSASTLNAGVKQLDATVSAPMSDEQKAGVKQQAEAAVNANFDEATVNGNVSAAVSTFASPVVDSTASAGVSTGAKAAINAVADGIASSAATNAASTAASYQAQYDAGAVSAAVDALIAAGTLDADTGAVVKSAVTGVVAQQDMGQVASAVSSQVATGAKGNAEATASQIAAAAAPQVAAGVKASANYTEGLGQVASGVTGSIKSAAATAAGTAAVSAAESTKATIKSAIETPSASGYSLVTGMEALAAGTNQLNASVPTLTDGVSKLYNGSNTLVSNNGKLNDGAAKLNDATGQIVDGVSQLDEGANKLADGMVEFNEKGIEKLINAYNGDVKALVDRIQAVMNAGSDYDSFAGKNENMVGNTKFIIKTAPIEVKKNN